MRIPLFARMRAAKSKGYVPENIRHSGILSYEYVKSAGKSLWLLSFHAPSGVDLIDEIARRIYKNEIVSLNKLKNTMSLIANSIYDHRTQYFRYIDSHCRINCGSGCGLLVYRGENVYTSDGMYRVIPISIAKSVRCRWCGSSVFVGDSWKSYRKYSGYHCGSIDCRRMDFLAGKPQSRGGIDLTPGQRSLLGREAYDSQRAINYLMLVTKEVRKKCKLNKS